MLINSLDPLMNHYSDGVRVQMLIDRSVGNTNKGSKRWVNKLISRDIESYKKNVDKLLTQQQFIGDPNIRLYASVNSRKVTTAVRMLHHAMIDLPPEDYVNFYTNIHNKFVSCLMKPASRLSKYFIIDVDDPDFFPELFISSIALAHKIHTHHYYKTPGGWHIITNPFDIRLLADTPKAELKTDGLILLNVLE